MVFTINTLKSAKKRTFYFIGVTTGQSAIMKLFPKWAEFLGLKPFVSGKMRKKTIRL